MDEAYESCEWIEGGLAFNRRSLHTCLIVHHRTGLPFVADYEGGEVPLETLLTLREQIRTANRQGGGHHECRGCPHLRKQHWPRTQYPIEIVGIAHYSYCNIKCSYCFLQTQDPDSFAAGYKPYSLLPAMQRLIQDGLLAPHAIIDWGGGEPTSYPEFDELLQLLLAHGSFHYVHTNGTRFPSALRRTSSPERVHVICSVDAGLPETYVRIKERNYLNRVWANLQEYIRVGSIVTLKYIVKEENCSDADLKSFVTRAAQLGPRDLIVDFDYDFPEPGPEVLDALSRLKAMAMAAGIPARFGFTGANFAPEHGILPRAESGFFAQQQSLGRPYGKPPAGVYRNQFWSRFSRLAWRMAHWYKLAHSGSDKVRWLEHNLPAEWYMGGIYRARVRFRNEGTRPWPAAVSEGDGIDLVVLVDGQVRYTVHLPHDTSPGEAADCEFGLEMASGGRAPTWEVKLALIEQKVGWLEFWGAEPLVVRIRKLASWPMSVGTKSPDQATPGGTDATTQGRPDQSAGVHRRVWHVPVTDGSGNAGD
jgi:pyruvate-formate lyase-activating enzyme